MIINSFAVEIYVLYLRRQQQLKINNFSIVNAFVFLWLSDMKLLCAPHCVIKMQLNAAKRKWYISIEFLLFSFGAVSSAHAHDDFIWPESISRLLILSVFLFAHVRIDLAKKKCMRLVLLRLLRNSQIWIETVVLTLTQLLRWKHTTNKKNRF